MFFYRTLHHGLKTIALMLRDMLDNLFAHGRRPKTLDVAGDVLFGLLRIRIGIEETANLVSHGDEMLSFQLFPRAIFFLASYRPHAGCYAQILPG
jgi:hypothetical protein